MDYGNLRKHHVVFMKAGAGPALGGPRQAWSSSRFCGAPNMKQSTKLKYSDA